MQIPADAFKHPVRMDPAGHTAQLPSSAFFTAVHAFAM
jgi:hypothetical protein